MIDGPSTRNTVRLAERSCSPTKHLGTRQIFKNPDTLCPFSLVPLKLRDFTKEKKRKKKTLCVKIASRGKRKERGAKSREAILATAMKMADSTTRGEVRKGRGEVVFDGALRILDRVEQRSASGSDGRSVYKLQTMALFPREKRDTTVK